MTLSVGTPPHWLMDGTDSIAPFFGSDAERWPARIVAWQRIAQAADRLARENVMHSMPKRPDQARFEFTANAAAALADLLVAVGDLRDIEAQLVRAEGGTT